MKKKRQQNRCNIIVIFTENPGYGNLGVFGHPTIKTPNLDKMPTLLYLKPSIASTKSN